MFGYPFAIDILTRYRDPCTSAVTRRGWRWRCVGGPCRLAHDTGDLVSLRIHALLIGNVVAPLELILRGSARVTSHGGSAEETDSATDCSTGTRGTRVTRGSTDRRAHPGPNQRSDDRSGGCVLIGGFTWR